MRPKASRSARSTARPSSSLARTAGLLALLPRPTASAETLDTALARAIIPVGQALARNSDTTAATKTVRELLSEARHTLDSRGALPWSMWAKIARLKPAKTSDPLVEPVRTAAAVHPAHPQLHADLSPMIKGVFAADTAAAEQFQSYKRAFGLVDFAG